MRLPVTAADSTKAAWVHWVVKPRGRTPCVESCLKHRCCELAPDEPQEIFQRPSMETISARLSSSGRTRCSVQQRNLDVRKIPRYMGIGFPTSPPRPEVAKPEGGLTEYNPDPGRSAGSRASQADGNQAQGPGTKCEKAHACNWPQSSRGQADLHDAGQGAHCNNPVGRRRQQDASAHLPDVLHPAPARLERRNPQTFPSGPPRSPATDQRPLGQTPSTVVSASKVRILEAAHVCQRGRSRHFPDFSERPVASSTSRSPPPMPGLLPTNSWPRPPCRPRASAIDPAA